MSLVGYRIPLKHGDKFRLQHVRTGKNLHSHNYAAPLSSGFEVSCFGSGGRGDECKGIIVEYR